MLVRDHFAQKFVRSLAGSNNRPSPEGLRGQISGLSRSRVHPGPSVGTAVPGTILVSGHTSPDRSYAHAMMVLAAIGGIGIVAPHVMPTAPPGSRMWRIAKTKSGTSILVWDLRLPPADPITSGERDHPDRIR